MKRVSVASSSIAEVGYDTASSTLEIQFVNGRTYQYFDVPANVHEELLNAVSVGQFFQKSIRGVYRFARV